MSGVEFTLIVVAKAAQTLIEMFQTMSKNKEAAQFLCARISILQEVLNGFPPDNYDRGAVRHIGEVMQECYEIFTKILRRNSINAFLLSMDDKKDIATMGGRLDACI